MCTSVLSTRSAHPAAERHSRRIQRATWRKLLRTLARRRRSTNLRSRDALHHSETEALLPLDLKSYGAKQITRAPEEVLAMQWHREHLEQPLDGADRPG